MALFEVDTSELEAFTQRIGQAKSRFKRDIAEMLEKQGENLLEIVADRIVGYRNIDTGRLLASFSKGDADNIWVTGAGGLTLEVGTSVEYADYVNTGHWQRPGRFIPGEWNGDRFTYIPGHKGGMVLKADYVEGSYYWDDAVNIFERMFPEAMAEMVYEWFERNFV